MRRMARAVPLARERVDHLVNKIRHAPPEAWPEHLGMAREILKQRLAEALARDVLTRSIVAACKCAESINRKSAKLAQMQIEAKAADAFERVAKCITRAPARLRQHLDDGVASVGAQEPVDTEVVADVIEAAIAAFSAEPECEPAQTALTALTMVEDFDERRCHLRNDYAALSWRTRAKVESALSALRPQGTPTAAIVFATMASATRAGSDRGDREIHTLIVDYVVEVADIWRSAGLWPTRVFNRSSVGKRSKFHHFVDLVLTAIVEPQSRRHDSTLDAVKQQILAAHARLPESLRPDVAATLRHCDVEWLVSDDHLKKALREPAKKNGCRTRKIKV
jgi:hypothetical protein